MKNPLLTLLSRLGFTSSSGANDIAPREGECWSYVTRSVEESAFVVIRKIEVFPAIGEVIHVSVYGVKI
jgi:hypothetical protein